MKNIITLFIMIIVFNLTGCSLNNNAYLVRAGGPNFNHGSTYVINSVEELNEYVSGTYNSFDKAVEKYDEDYFENSALIIAEITKNTGSAKLTIKSIDVKEKVMIIKFKTRTPNIVTCDMAYWHILVECTQEEANCINNIKVYDSGNLVEGRV